MYKFLLRIVSVLIKIIYRVRVNGIENFKDDEPIIISANHIHIFDPVILATLTKKQIFFLAKKELFDKKFSAKFFSKLGVIPIDRENTDLKAIKSKLNNADKFSEYEQYLVLNEQYLKAYDKGLGVVRKSFLFEFEDNEIYFMEILNGPEDADLYHSVTKRIKSSDDEENRVNTIEKFNKIKSTDPNN